jgi:predicted esterase
LVVVLGTVNPVDDIVGDPRWRRFCLENRCALIAPGFVHNEADWRARRSFQYPGVWSGEALVSILEAEAQNADIDPGGVFLFGFSGGAQFAHRFALLYPERVVAAHAHAAGEYTLPTRRVSPSFLISVGSADDIRIAGAREFVRASEKRGIDVEFYLVDDLGHALDERVRSRGEGFLAAKMEQRAR